MRDLQIDSLILDVDGTLWDSTGIVAGAWTQALLDSGCKGITVTPELLKSLFGKTMDVIADHLVPHLPKEERKRLMDDCCVYEHQALEADECRICYSGVCETIQKLSESVPVCIVSNCQSGYIELFLEKTGLGPYITDTECFGNTGRNKGENIRLVAERNHFRAPVYVGDTQGDAEASAEAGIPFVFASYGFGHPERADVVIETFEDLLKLIGR